MKGGGVRNCNFRSTLDSLAKMDAKSQLPSGGSQYTMEVALGPSASAKGQALMRNQKVKPQRTQPLRELQQKQQKMG